MTVKTDIALAESTRRKLFLKIDGWEGIAWQDDGTGVDPGWSRTGYVCLLPPASEWSHGLDLGEMKVTAPSVMFELLNIQSPEGTYYWAQQFASGRWDDVAVNVSWIVPTGSATYLNANVTTITVNDTTGWPSSGKLYFGQEACTYTGKTPTTFTGLTRGIYPCVGTAWNGTYNHSRDPSAQQLSVASVPMAWVGRRVALYVITWDDTTGAWHPEGDEELLWVGRITDAIRFNGDKNVWQMGCESILRDLDKEICTDLAKSEIEHINLSGTHCRKFWADVRYIDLSGATLVTQATGEFELTAGIYTHWGLLHAIMNLWNDDTNWTYYKAATRKGHLMFYPEVDKVSIGITHNEAFSGDELLTFTIFPYEHYSFAPCHAFYALGFEATGADPLVFSFAYNDAAQTIKIPGGKSYATAYHPLSTGINGYKLACKDPSLFTIRQYDNLTDATPNAAVRVEKASVGGGPDAAEAIYYSRYTSEYSGLTTDYALPARWLVLVDDQNIVGKAGYLWHDYVCRRADEDDPVNVQQVYYPTIKPTGTWSRGPFESLLFVILSTGSANNNDGVYDKLPLEFSLGIQAALVDKPSFLAADQLCSGAGLNWRHRYIIDEATKGSELLQREGKLFGYFVAWDRGKLRLKSIKPDVNLWIATLSDSTNREPGEFASVETSVATVINGWRIECNRNNQTDKYEEIEINDVDSQTGLQATKLVDLKHPGLHVQDAYGVLQTYLRTLKDMFRFPWQVVDVSQQPQQLFSTAIGDVVRYTSSWHPDPYGTGSMTTACLGIIINETVNWGEGTKTSTVLLYARYDAASKTPWGAAALVDIAATNGGWNAGTYTLTLVAHEWGTAATDSHDGAAFAYSASDPDAVMIVESAPADPAAPQAWGPFDVGSAYNAGARTLLLAGTPTLTGWSATTEYRVVPAVWANAGTTQKTLNLWQANATSGKLVSDKAQRWG